MIQKNSWYKIITAHLVLLVTIIALDSALNVLHPLLPLWLFSSITDHNRSLFLALFGIWLAEIFLAAFLRIIYTKLEVTITSTLCYTSYQKIFQNNLIVGSQKETGVSISKIERAIQSYKELLTSFIFAIIPTVIRTITVIITLFCYASPIASYTALLLIAIACLHSYLYWRLLKKQETKCIETQDSLKNFIITHSSAISLIQASGATEQILARIKKLILSDRYNEIYFWNINAQIHAIISFLYLVSVALVSSYFFNALFYGQISITIALGLLGSYMRSTSGILYLERPLRTAVKALADIQDFFSYMHTIPDNQNSEKILLKNRSYGSTTINIKSLSFGYSDKKILFNNLALFLEVPHNQENKLYVITGPSGSGKSSFALLLSGCIQPTAGTIIINTISAHDLLESERQKLVLIQIQTDYMLSDTIYQLLLLGLPEYTYTKKYLLELLEKYNLETVSLDKHEILSAGQRQKILFINTYLRARYFKPAVIILDEPTSYLDTLSEEKIFVTIQELAQNSVIFLITHKKELAAKGYMFADFSLVHKQQKINFSCYT